MSETEQTEVPSALQIIEDSLDQFTTTDFIERDWGEIAAQSVKDALEQAGFKIVRDDEDAELTRLQQANAALVERENGLREALELVMQQPRKSIDRDNMEFELRLTCYVVDKAQAALASQ